MKKTTNFGKLLELQTRIYRVGLRDLGKQIGVSAATLSRINRSGKPDLQTWLKITEWLLKEAK